MLHLHRILRILISWKFTSRLGNHSKPFDQLMGVLPAASAHALPLFYRKLMTDGSSPIFDFYPTDFELDMNGKRFSWQAICKLPFIKESRLLSEIAKVEHTLTDEEKRRNNLGLDVLFVHISHPLVAKILSFCKRKKDHPKLPKAKVRRKINPNVSGGMNGYIYISDKPVWPVEIYSPIEDMEMIMKNEVISVFYKYPPFHNHIPRPPKGVILPRKAVSKQDILPPAALRHEKSSVFGRTCSERSVYYKHPRPLNGVILPQKDILPPGLLWHERLSFFGRTCSERKRKWSKGYSGSDNKFNNQKSRADFRPRKKIRRKMANPAGNSAKAMVAQKQSRSEK
ncbi:hypothetical protein L1049_002419 [Liquidambar formosana]|uniref:Xrn1 helical domain-containing protein n=1 Tax=Liquidambar formosana TaxID=63359 RepID=A0AAP0NFM8_LIQFO